MKRIRLMTIAALAALLILPSIATAATTSQKNTMNSFAKPDFAYPKTVDRNARAALEKGVKSADWESACLASVQILLAQSAVSQDSIGSSIAMIDSLAEKAPEPWRGMLLTLEATAYNRVYQSDSWTFDQRNLPTDAFPANMNEWSANLFALKLMELADRAVSKESYAFDIRVVENLIEPLPSELKKGKIVSYQPWFPTVGDFVSQEFCSILNAFADKTERIPFGTLSAEKQTVSERVADAINRMYDFRLENAWQKGDDRAVAQAAIDRAYFLNDTDATIFINYAYNKLRNPTAKSRLMCWLLSRHDSDDVYEFSMDFIDEDSDISEARKAAENTDDELTKLLTQATELADANPDGEFTAQLRNHIAEMTAPRLLVIASRQNLAGKPIEVVVRNDNMKKTNLLLISVPENCERMADVLAKGKVMHCLTFGTADEVPFSVTDTIRFEGQKPGRYCIMPSSTLNMDGMYGRGNPKRYVETFSVSDLAFIFSRVSTKPKDSRVYLTSGFNQEPVSNVAVKAEKLSDWNSGKKAVLNLKTEDDGGIALPPGSWELTASHKGNVAKKNVYIPEPGNAEPGKDAQIDIFTDLALYKPGQTLNFVAVTTSVKDSRRSVEYPDSVSVVLFDANRKEVERVDLKAAADGRAVGSFRIPEGRLNGSWRIGATTTLPGVKGTVRGDAYFQVEDYKAPSFFVEIDSIPASAIGKPFVVSGIAKTYSGLPVADADVRLSIRTLRFWWRYSGTPDGMFSTTVRTDSTGRFTARLSTDRLKDTRYEEALMSVSAEITDAAGETQISPAKVFSFKSLVSLSVTAPEIASTDDQNPIKVTSSTATGEKVNVRVKYDVVNIFDPSSSVSGEFVTPDCPVSPSQLVPGKYKITFSAPNDVENQLGFASQTVEMTVYDRNNDRVPYPTELWVNPMETETLHGSATIRYGSAYPDSRVLVQVSDCNRLISREWVRMDSTMRQLRLRLPEPGNRIYVQITASHDLRNAVRNITISNPKDDEQGRFETVSFRDRLTPGSREKWTFRFLIGEKGRPANVLATMTDKALNAIVPFNWSTPGLYINWPSVASIIGYCVGNTQSSFRLSDYKPLPAKGVNVPELYMYGQYFGYGMRRMYTRGAVYDLAATADGVVAVSEEVIPTSMVINEMKMSAAPMMKEESAEAEIAADSGNGSGAGSADDAQVKLRPSEMPVAFFKPMLTASKDGSVEISFEVPDFNTTWALQLVGYDNEVHSAKLTMDAVAAKAVMVRPNLPRFLRSGDVTRLRATLFNNSGKTAPVGGRIDVLDALTDKVIASREFEAEQLADAASRVVSLDFTAPADCEYLAVRCYATIEGDARHTDGEQSLVVVLPASEPVVESTPFWLAPGQNDLKMQLPAFNRQDSVWLTYCNNPVWLCLTALPDITTAPGKDLFSKVAALYGRSIAAGIVREMPRAGEAVTRWLKENSSALLSPLEKNAELKTLAIERTPWVANADSETLRMLQLGKLVDEKENEKAIDVLMGEIMKCQQGGGGFSWCPGFEPSVYSTSMPLLYYGMLRQFGYEPKSKVYANMLKDAVSYCDREIHKEVTKDRVKIESHTLLNWLYIRSFYPEIPVPANLRQIYSEAIRKIADGWRDFGIYEVATAAIVLNRNERHAAALQILASLREKASFSPERGYWFDNLSSEWGAFNKLVSTAQALEAFSEISSDRQMVNGLRQWLVVQRQAEDWGRDRMLAEVVNVVLRSGTDWTVPAGNPEIKIGRKKLKLKGEEFTGSVTVMLNPKDASGAELTVAKRGEHPSWGAVVSRRYLKPQDVTASATPDVKIEKSILKVVDNDGIETLEKVGEKGLKVGDRVRVLLTVTASRDAEYVAMTDSRGAFLEPAEQVSGMTFSDGLMLYRETRDSSTQFFLQFMPKGVHQLSYDCYVDRAGEYSLGIATLQSQYAPELTAHSAGALVTVE